MECVELTVTLSTGVRTLPKGIRCFILEKNNKQHEVTVSLGLENRDTTVTHSGLTGRLIIASLLGLSEWSPGCDLRT